MATSGDFPKRPKTSSFQFASTFQGEDALRTGEWVLSQDPKYEGQEARVRVERCDLEGGVFHGDYGLLLDESHKHYGVGATLPKPVDNTGKDLVLQYEVQVRGGANCGGAYVKMIRGAAGEDMSTLNNDSPYSIMFGPDKCFRDTDKVHFILQHQNPNTNEWEEKHFGNAPKIKDDGGFHVYTLHIKKDDSSFDLYIDTEMISSGSLLADMKPPLVPPQEIDDPEDEQPEDWVAEAKIPDPSAVKPDDWDEDAPKKIVDEDAEMPEGWLEEEEEIVPDPSSSRPDDWDGEEDGDWEPTMIINKACDEAPGCGKWVKPLIANPAYKGKWSAPKIDNPDYTGEWQPRKIPNPAYFDIESTEPSHVDPITGIAVEIWTVDGGVWLDNFVIGHDIGDALSLAEQTWRPKFKAFEAVKAAEKKQKERERADKRRERESNEATASWNSKMTTTSRLLADKARPYVPAAAAPALDAAAENPIAVVGTMLAGMLVMILLSVFKTRSSSSSSSSSSSNRSRAKASAPPTEAGGDNDWTGDEGEGEGDVNQNKEEEEEHEEEEDEDEEEEEEEEEDEEQEEQEQEGEGEGEGEQNGEDSPINKRDEVGAAADAPEGEVEEPAPISST